MSRRTTSALRTGTAWCTLFVLGPAALGALGGPVAVAAAQALGIQSVEALTRSGVSVVGKDVEQGAVVSVAVTVRNEGPGASGYVCTRTRATTAIAPLTQDCKEIPGDGGRAMFGMDVRVKPDAPLGPAALTVEIDGGSGRVLDTETVQLKVAAVNRAPAPANPSVVVQPGTARTFTAAELATDPDGESVSVAKGTIGPAHGTLTVSGDSTQITYQPAQGYQGPDRFQYIVTDSRKKTAVGTVTLQVCSGASCPQPGQGGTNGTVPPAAGKPSAPAPAPAPPAAGKPPAPPQAPAPAPAPVSAKPPAPVPTPVQLVPAPPSA